MQDLHPHNLLKYLIQQFVSHPHKLLHQQIKLKSKIKKIYNN